MTRDPGATGAAEKTRAAEATEGAGRTGAGAVPPTSNNPASQSAGHGQNMGQIRRAHKGRWFEDFEPGMVLNHKWGRTITRAESASFATQTMNYNPLWFNVEYARSEGHPDIVVCPWYLLNLVLGMSVEDVSEHATALLGYGDMSFHRDVYPEETITATSEVVDLRASSSKPDQGILKVQTRAVNQRGEPVLSYTRTNLIRRRAGGTS